MHKRKLLVDILITFILSTIFVPIAIADSGRTHLQVLVQENRKLYEVTKVIDADTIEISNGYFKVQIRLLGINSPEVNSVLSHKECFGEESTAYVGEIFKKYNKVALELDPENRNVDAFQRFLRYVDIPISENNYVRLNEVLVAKGYAYAAENYPLSQLDKYKELQTYAIDNHAGLWGECHKSKYDKISNLTD